MHRLRLFAALITFIPALASAAQQTHTFKDLGRKLNGVACNASAGSRTFTLDAGAGSGFGLGVFQINFTRSAATAVSMTCDVSLTDGVSWAQIRSISVATGVGTSTAASWTETVSASTNIPWRVDFLGASDVRCVISCTGGGASDLITVYGRLSTL